MPQVEQQDTARPRFFMEPVENVALSKKEGRPIFEDTEMVELKQPGDKHWSWVGRVDEPGLNIRQRFPQHYEAFKRGEQRAAIGTPLEAWPLLTKSRVMELKAANVMTVEELAQVPDNVLGKLGMNSRQEREQAKAWIDSAKGNAATSAMAAELAQLREMVEKLSGGAIQQPAAISAPPQQQEKTLEDCTDAELKEYIKRETGEYVRGNPSRDTLMARAASLAKADA